MRGHAHEQSILSELDAIMGSAPDHSLLEVAGHVSLVLHVAKPLLPGGLASPL